MSLATYRSGVANYEARLTAQKDALTQESYTRSYAHGIFGRDDGFAKGNNDNVDAFRHQFATAILALENGNFVADALTTQHEITQVVTGDSTRSEARMDLNNNTLGLGIADQVRSEFGWQGGPPTEQMRERAAELAAQNINEGKASILVGPGANNNQPLVDQAPAGSFEDGNSIYSGIVTWISDQLGANFEVTEVVNDIAYSDFSGIANLSVYVPEGYDSFDVTGPDWGDPVVISLTGGSVATRNRPEANIKFDMDGDGKADQTAWIAPGQGFLVVDLNGNGRIDDRSEMISDVFGKHGFSHGPESGYAVLEKMDKNHDGRVDAHDKGFGDLRLWLAADGQGSTLVSLAEAGIREIVLDGVAGTGTNNGNKIERTFHVVMNDGTIGQAAEVAFQYMDQAAAEVRAAALQYHDWV